MTAKHTIASLEVRVAFLEQQLADMADIAVSKLMAQVDAAAERAVERGINSVITAIAPAPATPASGKPAHDAPFATRAAWARRESARTGKCVAMP